MVMSLALRAVYQSETEKLSDQKILGTLLICLCCKRENLFPVLDCHE